MLYNLISTYLFLVARRVLELKKDLPMLVSKLKVLYSVEILQIPKVIINYWMMHSILMKESPTVQQSLKQTLIANCALFQNIREMKMSEYLGK